VVSGSIPAPRASHAIIYFARAGCGTRCQASCGTREGWLWDPPGMIAGPAVRLVVGPARAGYGTCPLSSGDPHVRSIVPTCGTCSQISLWDPVVRLKFANLNGHIDSHMDMTHR
jgi:hypothetical protein